MKIVYIAPGTGGAFYCQNCMRDVDMVRALRHHGHEVVMVPVYQPILIDANGLSKDVPVFFGGVNVYLQQKFGVFRKTPRWLDKFFDSPWMLRKAAAREGTTESAGLGPMILSMLEGATGNQKKELDRLVDWMVEHEKPDVVHLSNSLLLGMASELKSRLNVPLVCTLQDEAAWLDGVDPAYSETCWQAMSDRAANVSAFVAVSDWYGGEMRERMGLPDDKVHVVPVGIDLSDRGRAPLSFDPPVIGYLSKMTESLGLGLLTDAFIQLKKNSKLNALKLRATGGRLGKDIEYVANLEKKLAKKGLDGDAEFMTEFDGAKRREFLESISVLSVPAPKGESFGMFIIEALAAGVPVVQPSAGAFPEVVEATGGGVIYDVNDSGALARELEALLLDPPRARALGERGRERVFEELGMEQTARKMAALYEAVV